MYLCVVICQDNEVICSVIRSIFCLNPAGDTPSSARLFDAIVSGCIPVIVSDELELPFEGILDYRKVFAFVKLLLLYFVISLIALVSLRGKASFKTI